MQNVGSNLVKTYWFRYKLQKPVTLIKQFLDTDRQTDKTRQTETHIERQTDRKDRGDKWILFIVHASIVSDKAVSTAPS